MNFKETKFLIFEDLKRLSNKKDIFTLARFLLIHPSFKVTFWFRIGSYLKEKKYIFKFLYLIVYIIHRHNKYVTGIELPMGTKIGKGLVFSHYSCIFINSGSLIGEKCTIFQGVTIGSIRGGGEKGGSPRIGNQVVIGPGAKLIGNITIGNNVFIGANAVVVSNIPDNAVVGGIPAKILNMNGYEKTNLY